MSDLPIPFALWSGDYPTKDVLYNWTRPGPLRDEMMDADVICHVHGRWLFNPLAWREYCTNQFRNRRARGEAAATT